MLPDLNKLTQCNPVADLFFPGPERRFSRHSVNMREPSESGHSQFQMSLSLLVGYELKLHLQSLNQYNFKPGGLKFSTLKYRLKNAVLE